MLYLHGALLFTTLNRGTTNVWREAKFCLKGACYVEVASSELFSCEPLLLFGENPRDGRRMTRKGGPTYDLPRNDPLETVLDYQAPGRREKEGWAGVGGE